MMNARMKNTLLMLIYLSTVIQVWSQLYQRGHAFHVPSYVPVDEGMRIRLKED